MSLSLSQKAMGVKPSSTLAITAKAKELKKSGVDVVGFGAGEPDFNTPKNICDAAIKAIETGFTKYTPASGTNELKAAISKKFRDFNGLDYAPEQIVVSTGGKQAIYQAVMATVNPGDEVIIPTPFWVSYKEIVKVAGGKCVYVKTKLENDFKVTAQQLEEAITEKTKLIMFSSPSNPTGMLYTHDELKAIADVVARHKEILVMSDEIYEHINFVGKHESIAQFNEIYEQVITVNGVAKGFAMTGWRIGFIGAPTPIAKACEKLQGQVTSATCSIAQKAALKAMQLNPAESEDIKFMRNKFLERRDLMYKLLQTVPDFEVRLPQGAFYFFPKVNKYYGKKYDKYTINNSNDLCMYILNEGNVALVPGVAFGDDDCIRFSYATSEDLLIEAVKRIKEVLAKLQ